MARFTGQKSHIQFLTVELWNNGAEVTRNNSAVTKKNKITPLPPSYTVIPIANVQDHVVPVKRGVLEASLALINAYMAQEYQWWPRYRRYSTRRS